MLSLIPQISRNITESVCIATALTLVFTEDHSTMYQSEQSLSEKWIRAQL